ncbi:MAG: xanthine phosphoribosyltransferase [Eubacteriales bacterium]
MEILKERIRQNGRIIGDEILRVDSFLNHQIDVKLLQEMAEAIKTRFQDKEITKIMTIEASGIAIGCFVAQVFDVPLVFARKSQSKSLPPLVYTAKVESFTHHKISDIMISEEFLGAGDKILIVDDFLANGAALTGLISLVEAAGAELVGVSIAIEKAFQPGGSTLREQGVEIYSLARIASMSETDGIVFAPDI